MTLNAHAVKVVRLPAMRFIGAKVRLNMADYDQVVEKFWSDKFNNSIASLSLSSVYGNRYGVIKPADNQGNVDYYAAVMASKATAVPADCEAVDASACAFASTKIRRPSEVARAFERLFNQFLKYDAPNYRHNPDCPCIVVYNRQTNDMRVHGLDVYVPIKLARIAAS